MQLCLKQKIGCSLLIVVVASSVWADGFRNPPEGAQALGKIGGRLVYMEDASAAIHNPANLPLFQAPEASVSVTFGYGKREFVNAEGARASSRDNWSWLPNLFAVYPLNDDGLVAGLSLTTPFGRSSTFSKTSPLRYTAPYFTELYAVNLNPVIAYRVNNRLSVAAGASLLYSELELRQIFPWAAVTQNPETPDGATRFQADGYGFGYNAAITWNITQRQRAALTYRSSIKVDYDGDLRLSNVPPPAQLPPPLAPLITPKSDFDTEIEFPAVLAFGYGLHLTDRIRVEANVEWVRHSLFEALDFDADNNTPLLGPNSRIEADWKDNWTYGLGADFRISEDWTLRAGYIYLETPIPGRTMLPTISEENQSVISLGLGFRRGAHQLDLAYAYGLFSGRRVSDNEEPAFNGKHDFDSHLIGASYALTF